MSADDDHIEAALKALAEQIPKPGSEQWQSLRRWIKEFPPPLSGTAEEMKDWTNLLKKQVF